MFFIGINKSSLREFDVFHIQLQICFTLPSIVFQMIADAEWRTAVDAIEQFALRERNARKDVVA